MKPIKAWHFVSRNKRLGYEDNRIVRVGKTYKLKKDKPELCTSGMHGSKRIMDALGYALGPIICRVEIWGNVIHGDSKLCGTHRKVLGMIDGDNILYEFACRCAEDALALAKRPDPRSVAAIQARRDFTAGKITAEELARAARDATGDAAWAAWAAWDAARDAAWAAAWASRDATWAAARDAAWAATWAAMDAAWAAVGAARDAAWAAQNRRLASMVVAAMRKEKK